MKPDWKDAPEWANYLAMDDDGCWTWFEDEPETEPEPHATSWWRTTPDTNAKPVYFENWRDTLEQRPK